MRWKAITAAAFTLTLTLAGTSPASAERFPEIVPDWYNVAAEAPYAEEGSFGAMTQWRDEASNQVISYWSPTQRAPGGDAPDIEIANDTLTTDPDVAKFDLSLSVQLETDMRTKFTEGLVIPSSSNTLDSQLVAFDGRGGFRVTRPAMPSDCEAIDTSNYDLRLALLGDNLHKYLVDVKVTFGDRSEERDEMCVPAQAPVAQVPEQPVPLEGESFGTITPPAIPEVDPFYGFEDPPYDWWPVVTWVGGAALLVAAIGLVSRYLKAGEWLKKNARPARVSRAFDHDGNPLTPDATRTEAPAAKTSRTKIGELLWGRPKNEARGVNLND